MIFSVPSCNVPTVVFFDQERTEDCEMIDVENLITLTFCQRNKTSGSDVRTLELPKASVIQTEWF